MTKKSEETGIIDHYMKIVLESGEKPVTVYQFCKLSSIDEKDFYKYFGSFRAVEKRIFEIFFDEAMKVLKKNKEYSEFDYREKLLSFYYTVFAVFAENRSYILQQLDPHTLRISNLDQLSGFRGRFRTFIVDLTEDQVDKGRSMELKNKAMREGAWLQFLTTLRFWLEDDSGSFEKTDIFIEKSLKATFDLIATEPLKSLVDLGKVSVQGKSIIDENH